jgi:hypothetical protein
MPKKPQENEAQPADIWIAKRYTLKGPSGERAWEKSSRRLIRATNRCLELDPKKPEHQ